jgi:4-aminobutyrate aminotransferase-like enzyme/Ser/Thr protein kinase RdoA (MazF antagonist)
MTQLSTDAAQALAREALTHFPVGENATLTFIKQRENVVFRVQDGAGDYALRLHRHGHRTAAQLRSELDFMASLARHGLPVSRPVSALSGEPFVLQPDAAGEEHQVDLQVWVDGAAGLGDAPEAWRGDDNPDPEHFEALGRLAAAAHAASRAQGPLPGFSRPAWDVEGLLGERALWGDPRRLAADHGQRAAIEAAALLLTERLTALGAGPDVYGVIHADFTPENVLVSPAGLTLIDFDDFGEGFWLFDLATILFWYQNHPRAAEYRAALLRGYEASLPISPLHADALDALILARGLTYLGWAADRPGDETSVFLEAEVLPVVAAQCAELAARDAELIERRGTTIGPYSPLFYRRPRHFVRGEGVWLTDAHGRSYLDAYNNVPQVGHANPRVAAAVAEQISTHNVHTRYLHDGVVNYAEELLATFSPELDRVYFTNSGSESNDLALRIARQVTGNTGILISDFSYHGNTLTLAQVTTGLDVSEARGEHVRTLHIPDLDDARGLGEGELVERAARQARAAVEELTAAGFGVSAWLLDPSFSTEGLPRLPQGYLEAMIAVVREAGGLIIADEVQSGLGRLGGRWWGHQVTGIEPDLVTMGKPLGNGFPLGGVVTSQRVMDSFSPVNMYFNTFAGTPVASAAGRAVLAEVRENGLVERAQRLGEHVFSRLQEVAAKHPSVAAAKGRGLFFGLAMVDADGAPDTALAKDIVERMVAKGILISRIGPVDSVLKIRPPLVVTQEELDIVIDALDAALTASEAAAPLKETTRA